MLDGNFTQNMYRGTARFGDATARKRIYDYLTKLPGHVFAYDNKEVQGTVVADFATDAERNEFLTRFGNGVIVQTDKTAKAASPIALVAA